MTNAMLDPNPFHHAAALIEKMDRHDLEALSKLIAERSDELRKASERHCDLRWVSQDGRNAIANGKRGIYRVMAFVDGDGEYQYCLTISHRDSRGSVSHLATYNKKPILHDLAAQYDGIHSA